jgi:hypothetical protein
MVTAKVYIHFATAYDCSDADFSDEAALKMYKAESLGGPHKFPYHEKTDGKFNGYALGKHFMDLQMTMWKEDIKSGILFKHELLNDSALKPINEFIQNFLENIIL